MKMGIGGLGFKTPKLLRGENVALLPIQDGVDCDIRVSTKGYLKWDGKKYHHILDPHTGYPAETDVASLTIVSKQSVDCEIWTTRLFGKKKKHTKSYSKWNNTLTSKLCWFWRWSYLSAHQDLLQRFNYSKGSTQMVKLIGLVGTDSKNQQNRQLLQSSKTFFRTGGNWTCRN